MNIVIIQILFIKEMKKLIGEMKREALESLKEDGGWVLVQHSYIIFCRMLLRLPWPLFLYF